MWCSLSQVSAGQFGLCLQFLFQTALLSIGFKPDFAADKQIYALACLLLRNTVVLLAQQVAANTASGACMASRVPYSRRHRVVSSTDLSGSLTGHIRAIA